MRREKPIQNIIDNFKSLGRLSDESDGLLAKRIGNYPDWIIWEAYIEWFSCNEPGGEIGILDFIDESKLESEPPAYWQEYEKKRSG